MMKLSKWEGAILLLSTVFLAFTAGWFLRGGRVAEPLRVETQRRLEGTTVLAPAEEEPALETKEEREPEKVNINTADAQTLQTLPGIGEKRAADIVADREANGPYRFPEEITRVKGIGEETLAGLVEYITTEDEK